MASMKPVAATSNTIPAIKYSIICSPFPLFLSKKQEGQPPTVVICKCIWQRLKTIIVYIIVFVNNYELILPSGVGAIINRPL